MLTADLGTGYEAREGFSKGVDLPPLPLPFGIELWLEIRVSVVLSPLPVDFPDGAGNLNAKGSCI